MSKSFKEEKRHFSVVSIISILISLVVVVAAVSTVTGQTLPDLTVKAAPMLGQIPPGQTITIPTVVSNLGNINVNLSSIGLLFELTDLNGSVVLQNVTTVNLTNITSTTVNFYWTTILGNYTAKITVDPQNLMTESDENNNTVNWTMMVMTGNYSAPPPPAPVPVPVPVPIPSPVCPSSVYAPLITFPLPPCTPILTPTDDFYINSNTVLRQGVYNIRDAGAPGVIIINADNITIDLNGATIAGSGISNLGIGININNHNNVEIRNGNIRGYYEGIRLYNSNNCKIVLNNVRGNGDGIHIEDSSGNTIDTNYVSGNILGIGLNNADNNFIFRNNVSFNNIASPMSYAGIELLNSVNNTLGLNTVSRNIQYGIVSTNSSSTINDNVVCNNSQSDISIDTMTGSSGDCNYGDNPVGWSDTGVTGFTYNCTAFSYTSTTIPQIMPMPTPTPFPTCSPTPTSPTPLPSTSTPIPTPTSSIPTPKPSTPTPGFEAVFAIAGLLAVAYLLRRRK